MDSRISDKAYNEALEWLFSRLPMFSRIGAPAYKPGLETTEKLDRLFGHPHKRFKSIHIAGTNGKGSTSHLIASALQAAGYNTALYTSPHLVDFRERMRINGRKIPKENVVNFVEDWKRKDSKLTPSFFELTMMMAFDWFAAEKVDYAVIEVGMGGRLDSTNVITPLLSVITNISFDHTQFLGETLDAIAREKAGIIKPGIPVVIGEAEGDIKEIFKETAAEKKSPIIFSENYKGIERLELTENGWRISLPSGRSFEIPLGGNYQEKNIRTVLTALDKLSDSGIKISESQLEKGLSNVDKLTGLCGRWQKVGQNPDIICDTGHNEAGLKETLATLQRRYPGKRIRFVLGFVNDKAVDHIVDLFPKNENYYFTQADIPRAMPADKVQEIFQNHGISGSVTVPVSEAVEKAIKESEPDDVIYVGGSTFVVADFLKSPYFKSF